MNLNQRKINILEAIVADYILNGEPVGSRTIAKKHDLGISSATIRNEMSDLEEFGLIIQPHSSSGRIPSDKGYRVYVDSVLNYRELTDPEQKFLENAITKNITQIDYLMQQTAKALSILTNYTAVVSKPKVKDVKIKHIQLVPLDATSIIAVVVTENKVIKNHIINVSSTFSIEELVTISGIINSIAGGVFIDELTTIIKSVSLNIPPRDADLIREIIHTIVKNINEYKEVEIYTSGVNNILDFPEFSDIEKAKNIFQTIEEKDLLVNLLDNTVTQTSSKDSPIQITIGRENNMEQFKDCSIVKAEYIIDNAIGNIGIIGPTRMDYAQTVSALNLIVKNINKVINKLSN